MKSVIITGANRGIGLETALAFGRAGYKVYATMRNLKSGTDLKQKIQDESLPVEIMELDVDSDESVAHCIGTILQENGPIDVLVNNAGIERHSTIEDLDIQGFKAIIETNYIGAVRCFKAVLPAMRHNRKGCIINITSVAGKISCTPLGAYAASKFALEGISEALAQELKPFNIRVAIVEPGIIDTDMARAITKEDHPNPTSAYTQPWRFGGLFAASLANPTQASLVGAKILEIAESDSWQLRYPVGPDAQPFLDWRASMSSEEWVDWNAMNDEDWYNAVQNSFGLNARRTSSLVSG